jgi:hypothetical protein
MLYKLRNQQHPNHGDQWNFASLFDAEIKKWKEFVENGPSEFLVSPEESAAQADWLKREHAAMLDRLSLSNEELGKINIYLIIFINYLLFPRKTKEYLFLN